ncbi:MAG: allose kinase [Limnochordia bacterium]|jgi:allose kinase
MQQLSSVLGIDIGGTNIRLAHIDRNLKVIRSSRIKVEEAEGGLVSYLSEAIGEFTASAEPEIGAIGIGIPGIVSEAGEILSCPNLDPAITGINLRETLMAKFGVPVYVQKDVNFILYGEYRALSTGPSCSVLGFYVGTGLGFASVIRGRLVTGARGFAGELGHIPVKGKDDPCACGNNGCLELYAAGRRITELTAQAQTNVADFFVNPTHAADVQEWLDNLTIGMVTAITLLDPTVVIVGGGVADMQGFPFEELEKKVRARLRHPLVAENLTIKRSTAGQLGGCLGAAMYCFDTARGEIE